MPTEAHQLDATAWLPAWNLWNPAMGMQAAYNAKLHQAFLALSNEWQMFLGQRMKEDMQVVQQLLAAKSPEQVWSIYAKFWQKAAEDYAQEYAALARVAGECATFGLSAAEEALHAGAQTTSLSRAA